MSDEPCVHPSSLEREKFPFLSHKNTMKYISNSDSKVMFIMRGPSGSGKSSLVELLKETYPECTVCSADNYFTNADGVYEYNKEKLTEAHEFCHSKAVEACDKNNGVVVIDNTNIRRWESKFYFELSRKYSYAVVIVVPKTSWCLNYKELAKRNKHGVDEEILKKKVTMFLSENMNPIYWGWFINDKWTDQLLRVASECFSLCVNQCSNFAEYFQNNVIDSDTPLDFSSLYNRENSYTRTLHCTACFIGRDPSCSAIEYSQSDRVIKSIGKATILEVIGIAITPRTVGARIKLSPSQLKLWNNDEDVDDVTESLANLGLDGEKHHQFNPTSGVGARAHITLGCAKGVQAVETGTDLLQIIDLEKEALADEKYISTDKGAIRYYGRGNCVVYFDESVKIPCLFSGRY